jgi:hypothetical protein
MEATVATNSPDRTKRSGQRRPAGTPAPKARQPLRVVDRTNSNVRPISDAHLRAILRDCDDTRFDIDQWIAERIQAEPVRRLDWSRVVTALCIAVAAFCIVWFGGHLLIGALS